jgi:hypothetical protein
MATIENSELDFSELNEMSDLELDIFFDVMVQANTAFRESLIDDNFLNSLEAEQILLLKERYLQICKLFIDWELLDNLEDPIFIYEALENFSKDFT